MRGGDETQLGDADVLIRAFPNAHHEEESAFQSVFGFLKHNRRGHARNNSLIPKAGALMAAIAKRFPFEHRVARYQAADAVEKFESSLIG